VNVDLVDLGVPCSGDGAPVVVGGDRWRGSRAVPRPGLCPHDRGRDRGGRRVSVETVYAAFGTKATLLHKAWDITVGGDDQEIVFHERPEVLAIRAEPDLAKRFMLHARFSTQTAQRIAPFQLMVQAAAGADPTAAAMLEEMGRQRLAGITVMAAEAARTGQLAVSEDECRDQVWAMTDGMLWHRLVNERGWTNERFAEWLGTTWVGMLVRRGSRPTA
jgi:hypothetical protein